MAIATYADLTSAVASWLHRADLTVVVPDFITIGESRINRLLRVRAMETSATLTTVSGTRTVALPTRFVQARRLYVATTPVQALEYMTPADYWRRYLSTTAGTPEVYSVEGDNFLFGPIPDGTDIECLYYAKFAALSSSLNAVFTANPDLYLYASLVAAEPYIKNDKRVMLWKAQFDEILQEVQTESDRDRAAGAPMRIMTDYAAV